MIFFSGKFIPFYDYSPTYNELASSGNLNLISNDSIKNAINDLTTSTREIQMGMKDNKVPAMYGFKELFNLTEDEHARALKRVISAGVAQGLTANTIVKNLGIVNKQQIKNLEGNVFTVIADSRTQGNSIAFKELERLGVVSYYEHNSVLDSRTSLHICVPRDGRKYYQKWDDIGVQNIPPLHSRCRSKLIVRTGNDLSEQLDLTSDTGQNTVRRPWCHIMIQTARFQLILLCYCYSNN